MHFIPKMAAICGAGLALASAPHASAGLPDIQLEPVFWIDGAGGYGTGVSIPWDASGTVLVDLSAVTPIYSSYGCYFYVHVGVRNIGKTDINSTYGDASTYLDVHLKYDSTPAGAGYFPSMPPMALASFGVGWAAPNGIHAMYSDLNRGQHITEADYSNNDGLTTIKVINSPC